MSSSSMLSIPSSVSRLSIIHILFFLISSISLLWVGSCSLVSSSTPDYSKQVSSFTRYLSVDDQYQYTISQNTCTDSIINVNSRYYAINSCMDIERCEMPTISIGTKNGIGRCSAIKKLPKYMNNVLFHIRGGDNDNENNFHVSVDGGYNDNKKHKNEDNNDMTNDNSQQVQLAQPTKYIKDNTSTNTKNLAFISNSSSSNDDTKKQHNHNSNNNYKLDKRIDSSNGQINMENSKQSLFSVSNIAKDMNNRLNHVTTTFKRHGIQAFDKVHTFHGSTKQSLKSYMDVIKRKKLYNLVAREDDLTSWIDYYRSLELRNHIITSMKQIMAVTSEKCQRGTTIASNLLLGSGHSFQQDVVILSIAFVISLLGTSLGFHSFLYFVTVGYSVSIGLLALVSLIVFNVISSTSISLLSNIHTTLVVMWSLRLTLFLLQREFVNWKEWHEKLKETNESLKGKLESTKKIPIWITCSACYTCMFMPCIYRLKASVTTSSSPSPSQLKPFTMRKCWGIFGKTGIGLQIIGLLLETIADSQKARFKYIPGNRYLWCNVGLWSFSTHPNYFGEALFWLGTYFGGISCCNSIMEKALCTIGLVFILLVVKGAVDNLSSKHMRKWGHDHQWLEFKRTHSILGPTRLSTKNKKDLPLYR